VAKILGPVGQQVIEDVRSHSINRERKRCTGDGEDDNEGILLASILWDDDDAAAEQEELRDADCTAREAKLALRQEELTM